MESKFNDKCCVEIMGSNLSWLRWKRVDKYITFERLMLRGEVFSDDLLFVK
jgi:hypothetical protein